MDATSKRLFGKNLDTIKNVAKQFPINNETIIPPLGIDKLVEKTNDIIPEAFKINKEAVFNFNFKMKRANANALTLTAISGAAVCRCCAYTICRFSSTYAITKWYGIRNFENI